MKTEICVFDEHRCVLGEGARWIHGMLTWVDIPSGSVHRRAANGKRAVVELGQSVGCVAEDEGGRLIAGLQEGVAVISFEHGIERWLNRSIADSPNRRCNDGAIGPDGRFWVGTMLETQESGSGDLRRLGDRGVLEIMRTGLTIPNGIVWSLDGTKMYHIDSPRRVVEVMAFDSRSGEIGSVIGRIETPTEMGYPDGMAIDERGMLWIAHWGGGCVSCWDPQTGSMLDRLEVPATNVTSCCFGGDDLRDLYITSTQDETGSGGEVFVCRLGVCGV